MRARYVLISLLVHAAFIVNIHLGIQSSDKKHTELVQIDFKEVSSVLKNKGIKSLSVSRVANRKAKAKLKYGLFPKLSSEDLLAQVEKKSTAQPNSFSNEVAGRHFNDSQTYDKGIDEVFGEGGNHAWSYFEEVYRRIDTNLVFDSLLAQYNHFGRVYVQFELNDDGLFSFNNLKAEADDPILKVHVLRAIKNSLSSPFESTKRPKYIRIPTFKAEFNFKNGSSHVNTQKQNTFGMPVFVFNRATLEKPIHKKLVSYILEDGVFENPFLISERIEKYNKKKYLEAVQFDPFINYRKDPFYTL